MMDHDLVMTGGTTTNVTRYVELLFKNEFPQSYGNMSGSFEKREKQAFEFSQTYMSVTITL